MPDGRKVCRMYGYQGVNRINGNRTTLHVNMFKIAKQMLYI